MMRTDKRQSVTIRCTSCNTRYALGWEMLADNKDIWIKWATTGEARRDVTFTNVETRELYRLIGICSHCNDKEAT